MADEDMLGMVPKTEDILKTEPNGIVRLDKVTRVVVESPYAGAIAENTKYAQDACLDCMKKGEIPFASHLFFPQFLDENDSRQRDLGIRAGYLFWKEFDKIVFYTDRGISPGMAKALERTILEKKPYEFRQLPKA